MILDRIVTWIVKSIPGRLQSQPTRIFEETRRHSSKDKTADVRQVRYPPV